MQKYIKPIEGATVSLEKFDAGHPHTHRGRVYSQAKEPIEKSHNEPETRKKKNPIPKVSSLIRKVMATVSINQAIRR